MVYKGGVDEMIKKTVFAVLCILALLSVNAYAFDDVDSTKWYCDDVEELKERGVIKGYPDNTFRPGNEVTKAEVLTMLLKAADIEVGQTEGNHWASGVLKEAIKRNIVKDVENFNFEDKATRLDVAKYTVRALKLINDSEDKAIFSDTNDSDVLTLYSQGIVRGVLDGNERKYKPNLNINRAEMGVVVLRVVKRKENIMPKGEEIADSEITEDEIEEVAETEEDEIEEVAKTVKNEIEEGAKAEEDVFKLFPVLETSEYDISDISKGVPTKDDIKRLFVYMGKHNLLEKSIMLEDVNFDYVYSDEFKETFTLGFREAYWMYPEYFAFANGTSYKIIDHSDKGSVELVALSKNANFTGEEIKTYRTKFFDKTKNKVNDFIAAGDMTNEMSDTQKAKYLYEWVINNTSNDCSFTPIGYTGYGQITNGLAVCQGYVSTYNLMLKLVGIKAYAVVGQAKVKGKPVEHIWTMAYLDGAKHAIDVTWGDAYDSSTKEVSYKYFKADYETMRKTHTWDEEVFGK